MYNERKELTSIAVSILEIVVLSTPLAIVLLSLAFMPLIAKKFWQKNETIIFSILSVISIISVYSLISDANHLLKHVLVDDYLPFIIMLFTLYMLSHGIHIRLNASSDTLSNIIFLGSCSLFSSIIGTTGASMLFLRPFLEMNKEREHKSHLLIFFIFLISNIGGLLSPLGDPPLLLGYLHGIDFLWEIKNLFFYWLFYIAVCFLIFYFIDTYFLKKENNVNKLINRKFSIRIKGWINIVLIILTVLVLFFDFKNINLKTYFCDCIVPGMCIKNIILLLFCFISYIKGRDMGEKIDFDPFKEVARTFLVIFVVISPVLFILNENSDAIHKYIIDISNGSDGCSVFFWLCALASSFLDNAPSYLLFFNMAGGNSEELMYIYPNILKAISISSVVMGAMTYIGNAPNMMVKSIADKKKIKMPSFIGYIIWSSLIILPISFIVSYILEK